MSAPVLRTGETVTSASLAVNLSAINSSPVFNVDVYGLDYRTASTVYSTDFYERAYDGDPSATALQDDFVTSSSSTGVQTTDAASAMASYINAQYTASAVSGDFIFLRLSPDVTDAVNFDYYVFTTANGTTVPVLTIETVGH